MPLETVPINDERVMRLKKVSELRDLGVDPYPAISHRTHTIAKALQENESATVAIAGKIMTKREMGKLVFCHVKDESGQIQVVLKQDELEKESYKLFLKKIDPGDIVEFHGERFATQKGEESVLIRNWTLLTKTIRPLPDKFHGLHDEEMRLRKRYLDFIANPDVMDRFRRKAVFWQSMREFLRQEHFLEVETPVLENSAGGADAEPFLTHHNALGLDVYLRISMGELWQKRLMVGGFEKTFEIGRQFRNEGMSREHLQDYTQMEFYWAYANYEDGMKLVERLYKHVLQETFGRLQFDIDDFTNVDLSDGWDRIDYVQTIEEKTGLNVLEADIKDLHRTLDDLNIVYEKHEGKGRLIDSLWKYCRKMVKGPVFLVNLPVEVSPLAKRKADDPRLTERYQIIIAGSELGNGYSELNDPVDQAERFQEQTKLREAGDTEAQMHDEDFVEALEHGMPPTTGFGLSERVFSFFENKPIRECVLFPLMRPIHEKKEKV